MLYKKIKSFFKQVYLRYRFSKGNVIDKNVFFSKDATIDINVFIGKNTVIGAGVVLHKNVRVGRDAVLSNITVGANSTIESGVICTGYGDGRISIGKESYIGLRNILDRSDNINIGNYVHIAGPSTGLWTHSSAQMCLNRIPLSRLDDKNYRPTAPIIIEDSVYIGGNCTIYPGLTIHHHSIVAPNSVVTKDVKPHTMVGSTQARVIKKLSK